MKKYVLVRGDDWMGLYVDGVLVADGHGIELEVFAEQVGLNLNVKWADDNWLVDRGGLPESLDDVEFAE